MSRSSPHITLTIPSHVSAAKEFLRDAKGLTGTKRRCSGKAKPGRVHAQLFRD